MGFFANLFQFPFNEPWIKELNEKIKNAETDEEREMYEKELNNLMMIPYGWY